MKMTKSHVSCPTETYDPLTLDLYMEPQTRFFSEIYIEVCHLLDDSYSILGDIWVTMRCLFQLIYYTNSCPLDRIKEGRKAKI